MSTFLLNVLLAIIWAASTGEISLPNLALGYVLAFFILWLIQPVIGEKGAYVTKVARIISFAFYVLYHLILANLRVVRHVLSPIGQLRPGIVLIPLDAKSDEEIILLANVLTLMPGTLSLDVSDDRTHLYVHAMQISDREGFEYWIKDGLERRILRLLR
ncbi:Na+/H+ antiporter subunit E [soil metagenome]